MSNLDKLKDKGAPIPLAQTKLYISQNGTWYRGGRMVTLGGCKDGKEQEFVDRLLELLKTLQFSQFYYYGGVMIDDEIRVALATSFANYDSDYVFWRMVRLFAEMTDAWIWNQGLIGNSGKLYRVELSWLVPKNRPAGVAASGRSVLQQQAQLLHYYIEQIPEDERR